MAEMAKAAMDQMRQDRNPKPAPLNGKPPRTSRMAKSMATAGVPSASPTGKIAEPVTLKKEDWGNLPPKLAEDILKAQNEGIAPEYRQAVETYYRVIAEKSKKQ